MMKFFKFGSKESAPPNASKHSPKGAKGNTFDARKENGRQVAQGFGERLVQGGDIKPRQLEEALAIHNRSGWFLGQVLVDLGYLKRDAMVSLLKKYCGISCVQLAEGQVDRKLAGLIPQDICQTYTLIAVGKDGRNLTVAMADPLDKTALMKVGGACPHADIKPALCDRRQIESLHAALYGTASADDTDVSIIIRAAGRKQKRETPSSRGHPRLGELLIAHKVISQEQCDKALAYQAQRGGFLGQCLVKLGFISQDRLTCFLVKQLGIPYINLSGYEIQRDMLSLIPREICLAYCLLPMDALGRTLTVAMVNPFDTEALERIGKLHPNKRVKPVLCTWQDFKDVVAKEFLRGDKKLDESTLVNQKPKEAVLNEESIRDAVAAAITGLFVETAERPKEPPARPSHGEKTYVAHNPFVHGKAAPSHLGIDQYHISKEVLATIPKDICLAHRLLPLEKAGRVLAVAMVDTHNKADLELIHSLCPGLRVRPVPCSERQFQAAISRAFSD